MEAGFKTTRFNVQNSQFTGSIDRDSRMSVASMCRFEDWAAAQQRLVSFCLVLSLQHGVGENETGWGKQGRAGLIMDNLISAGIDANFRTLADQPNRAMAGLSMGGLGASFAREFPACSVTVLKVKTK
jgi:hypothetical protein